MKGKKAIVAALAVAAASCFLGIGAMGVGAEELPVTESYFGFETGASVRKEEPAGLRFIVNYGEEINELVTDEETALNVYIAPAEYFEKAAGDLDAVAARAVKAEIDKQTIYMKDDALYAANAVLGNVRYENINREFQAVAAIEKDGAETVYSEVSDARSIAYVASAAQAKGETEAVLDTFVQKGIAAASGVAEDEFVDGSYEIELTLDESLVLEENGEAALTLGITPAVDLYAEWASDNEEVAVVDENGKVTAVAEGTANITATVYGESVTCKVFVGKYSLKAEDFTAVTVDFNTPDGSAAIVYDTFEVGGKTGEFFKWTSSAYQPFLKLGGETYAELKAYCAANGMNALKVTVYPILTSNSFALGGGSDAASVVHKVWYPLNQWSEGVISVEDFDGIYLWSQSDGTTEVYFTVEPCTEFYQYFENLNASAPYSLSIAADKGEYTGENQFVYTLSGNAYRPTATMNAAGVAALKDFAAENGYNTVRVFNTALNDNAAFGYFNDDPNLYNTDGSNGWGMDKTVAVSELTGLAFWITSINTPVSVDIVLEFSYVKAPVVSVTDFSPLDPNAPYSLSYIGSKGDYTAENQFVYSFSGNAYQPTAVLSEEGIAKIKAFAEENGYNTLRCFVYTAAADDFSTFGFFNGSTTEYNTNGATGTWHIDKSVAISELTAFSFWTSQMNTPVSAEFVLEFLTK